MMNSGNSKTRILLVEEFFRKKTDESHIYNAAEICEYLAAHGIDAERKAIYSDIEALHSVGMDIICTHSPKKGYFLASREFEEAEARLMIDAVLAANFITAKKSDALVKKIGSFLSEPQAAKITDKVYINSARKCGNEEIYYSIDLLHKAICEQRQVSFTYFHRTVGTDLSIKTSQRSFTVSPYALIWSNDHYYLVCNNSKYDNLMHTRIDRMKKVKILDAAARPFSEVCEYREVFDSADYAGKLFNMFSGVEQKVTLRCSNSILEEIIDRFGNNMTVSARNADNFTAEVTAVTGEGFVSWVIQYGSSIKVLKPASLCEAVYRRTAELAKLYSTE